MIEPTLLALVPVLASESAREKLIRSAFATLGHPAPASIPFRGVVFSADGTIAICALTSKKYSGCGGIYRAWFSVCKGSYTKMDSAVTAAVALATAGASFLIPWPRLSQLVRAEVDARGGTRYQILLEMSENGCWALVQERGVRHSIDSFLIKAA